MLFLGVDAGGTKTHALLADETGAVLGVGHSGPGNWEGVGLDGAYRALRQAAGQALAEAGAAPADVTAAAYGLGGLDWPSDEERLRPVIERLGVGGPQVLVNDSFVALRAGAPWGVVIVAGTGTTCAGRNLEGATARTLGLGWTFDDWGSAPEMAEACVRAIAQAYSGHGPATSLTGRLARLFDAPDGASLLEGLSRGRHDLRAAVTKVIQALAEEASRGDEAAVEVSRRGGRELGERATTVIQRLGMEKDAPHVVLAGGLFCTCNPVLLEELEKTVRAVAPEACLAPLVIPPVAGAVLLAMEATVKEVTVEVHRRLAEEVRCILPGRDRAQQCNRS
jgi:N-acetylglucosamine kinase-like BadF-type ATPase